MQENTEIPLTLEHAAEVIGLLAKTLEITDALTAKLIEKRFLFELAQEDAMVLGNIFGARDTPVSLAQEIATLAKQKAIVGRVLQKLTNTDSISDARTAYMDLLLLNERLMRAKEAKSRIEYNGEDTNDELSSWIEHFGDSPAKIVNDDTGVLLSLIGELPVSNLADVPPTRSLVIN